MKSVLVLLATLSFSHAFAAPNEDLALPGERWMSKFTAYVCDDGNTQTASVPAEFAAHGVQLATATTDYSLDNLLIKGTFTEDGATCKYSALVFADNNAHTAKLVDSRAYAIEGSSTCTNGKAFLDAALNFNHYKYLHGRAAIYVPATDAAAQCGANATTVGLHFQVTGKIQ